MTVGVYLTTELQLENSYFLNTAANVALNPVRYCLGGKTVQIFNGACQSISPSDQDGSWAKTAFMIAAFIPGIIFGAIARGFSYAIEEVRVGFDLMKRGVQQVVVPQPEQGIDVGLLPIESVISEDIAFFKELLALPDDQLHEWLEKKKTDKNYLDAFYGASVLAESRISFDDIESRDLEQLLELFQQATQKLERVELERSKPSKSKISQEPKEISSILLNQLRRIKGVLADSEFDQFCTKLKLDPAHVRKTLHESGQVVRIQKTADQAIYFFLNLRDTPDNKVPSWLKAQRAAKNYIYPFFFSAKVLGQKDKYEKIIGRQAFEDIDHNYKEACERVTKLGLQAYITDKPKQ